VILRKSEVHALEAARQNIELHEAGVEFWKLKERYINPSGKFDHAHRFYLSSQYSCCRVRSPSRKYPYSQMTHGRTAEHVARSYGLLEFTTEIKTYARLCSAHPQLAEGPEMIDVLLRAHEMETLAAKAANRRAKGSPGDHAGPAA